MTTVRLAICSPRRKRQRVIVAVALFIKEHKITKSFRSLTGRLNLKTVFSPVIRMVTNGLTVG